MNTNTVENFEIADEATISTMAIIQFIYMLYLCTYFIMIYSCILMINYMKTAAYFNKEEEVLRLDKPEVISSSEAVASLEAVESLEAEEEMETLYVYDFEGTGEQLRRLRAYNPIMPDETADEYASRIWSMADKEDDEEEKKKEKEEEKRDINTWYKFADGKARYKGEWKNGLPNGKGTKHFYKEDSYIYGNFVDGLAYGYGKQTFEQTWEKTQPYYEGEFNRNNYDGKGEYHYGDGDYYKGMWKNNKYHGQGAAYSLRINRTWVGEYENDVKGEGNWIKGEI